MDYRPDAADPRFLLEQVLDAPARLRALAPFAEVDDGLMGQVLEEAARFVGEVIAPLNAVGDAVGARFDAGKVTMPPGFAAAYRAFWQAGWPALACAPEDGGQGLPWVLEGVLYEWLTGANHGWTMAPGLLHGAYECLKHHGSAELKARYLAKIASGEWLATMCLTEPQAGSDLGLVRTQAAPQADGSHRLSGTKIFISGGEHDLTDNIVHLVLAREPGAPPGPKGLSLFVTAKFLDDGARNAIHCERIEEKMGLHGSPTCVLRFDGASAWRVGEPGRGLAAMFVMMNAARLHVALQGVGLLEAAWQKARAYAGERLQMRAPGSGRTAGEADPIIRHPAMQRVLDTERAWIDGLRVLAYHTGMELDVARHHADPARRQAAQQWCSLVTPVLKSLCTEQGFAGASRLLQVFGGHGYVREWGIEQHVRDARITLIYEGTNEIQAIDLLARKVLPDGGAALVALLEQLAQEVDGAAADGPETTDRLHDAARLTRELVAAAGRQAALPYEAADDFLRATGLALLGWAWHRIARAPGAQDARWAVPHQALRLRVLPEYGMRAQILRNQCRAAAGARVD
ncbi:acyl-CoA dehydrogenase family protein [Ramlibacter tataouinensis]|uniref:acyl-CoA dehydrogenase family protein n=1 Tax=Ramlibacter tataouinensis TaxID=94132 RepID=UPI0022F3E605|nr:acyl-CoA dehydrogenase family protein [Ramlibacter tataouinensis]WBY02572.1 acyl-CoA dehydrogenase family protein [Ramlibacter tataouinensis]